MGSCRSLPEDAELQGRAWWLFEEEGEWLGFSPDVSEALEAAYQHWAEEPEGGALRPIEQEPGRFLYDATIQKSWWDSGYEHGGREKPQALRRISVQGNAARLPTRRELEVELKAARGAAEDLRVQRDNEAEAHKRRVSELESELCELRRELAEQREASERLLAGLGAAYPGRLVALSAGWESVLSDVGDSLGAVAGTGALGAGDVGRVRTVEGSGAAVDFCRGRPPLWLPSEMLAPASEAELLSRPGSRARLPAVGAGAERCRGVVSAPLDGAAARVLGADGRKRACPLQDLELLRAPRPSGSPLEVGDFVLADASCGLAVGSSPGMVLARDGPRLRVRFRAPDDETLCGGGGFRDVWLPASQLLRDELADLVRPGAAVRFRDSASAASLLPEAALQCAGPGRPAVGVVYAAHADGTAVVDFLGAFGLRCGVELLETVEAPTTVDHAVLRVLGECLAWAEVSAQHAEEREDDLLRRLARPRGGAGDLAA